MYCCVWQWLTNQLTIWRKYCIFLLQSLRNKCIRMLPFSSFLCENPHVASWNCKTDFNRNRFQESLLNVGKSNFVSLWSNTTPLHVKLKLYLINIFKQFVLVYHFITTVQNIGLNTETTIREILWSFEALKSC